MWIRRIIVTALVVVAAPAESAWRRSPAGFPRWAESSPFRGTWLRFGRPIANRPQVANLPHGAVQSSSCSSFQDSGGLSVVVFDLHQRLPVEPRRVLDDANLGFGRAVIYHVQPVVFFQPFCRFKL